MIPASIARAVGCVRNARTRFRFKRPQSQHRVVNCCPPSGYLIVTYKEKDYVQNCDVALTANTMTSIKVVFDAADKLRCEMVK